MVITGFLNPLASPFRDFYRQSQAAFRLAAMRAAMNAKDPRKHKLPAEAESFERVFQTLFANLPQAYAPIIDKLADEGQKLGAERAAVRKRRLGPVAAVNLAGSGVWKGAFRLLSQQSRAG